MADTDPSVSMFAEAEMGPASQAGYQVLARKYRPRLFSDLIGQDAMVRTLRNAFATGRVAHAFMLTGVRGVGKTTTARLLARALNYTREGHDQPTLELSVPGELCAAIMAGTHPDVLELDAASRPGVADMRDLLDGARYAPVSARYKVYIIDEVHMLSLPSFNALLKTLEEPPAHVKFIFATTEIRKVPITVLSRCQRFDLKRLDSEALSQHLGKIAKAEGAKISEEGLALIARAAEGSVRDGLSILDQAIVQAVEGDTVTTERVRDMLGLGDRLRLLDAFESALQGEAQSAVAEITAQLQTGADALILLKDMLDIAADMATVQAAGEAYVLPGPADWAQRTAALSRLLSPAQTQRVWKMLLSGYQDLQVAPDSETALRMIVLRLVAAARLPSPEEAAAHLMGGASRTAGKSETPSAQAPLEPSNVLPLNMASVRTLQSFDTLLERLDAAKEVRLWGEARQYIRAENFTPGQLICDVDAGAPKDLLRRLTDFLELDTGMDWQIQRTPSSAETVKERRARERQEQFDAARKHPAIQSALAALPGAEIVGVEGNFETAPAGESGTLISLKTRDHNTIRRR